MSKLDDDEQLLLEVARTLDGGAREALRRVTNYPAAPKGGWVGAGLVDLNPKPGPEPARPSEPPPTVPARSPMKPGDKLLEIEGKPKRRKKSG